MIPNFRLSDIIPAAKDLHSYYRYVGSMTTPGCEQAVAWTVFHKTLSISSQQVCKQLFLFNRLKHPGCIDLRHKLKLLWLDFWLLKTSVSCNDFLFNSHKSYSVNMTLCILPCSFLYIYIYYIWHFLFLSTPAGCNRSEVSILDGTADDWHLQTYTASGWQSCVPVQGRRSSDECDPLVVWCFRSFAWNNGSDTLTQHMKTPDLSDKSYCMYKGNFYLCYSKTTNF